MSFAAVIFDLDGTLIDTETIARSAGQTAFSQMGLPADDTIWATLVGRDQQSGEAILRERFGTIDIDLLNRLWSGEARRLESIGIALKSGTEAVLALSDARGLPRALATSSQRASAHFKLTKTGLSGFASVITADDVINRKPSPDPYLLAAKNLGVAPEDCLAFEDSEAGAEAAWHAGMRVVQVPDIVPATGRFAHHVALDLMAGAIAAGL